MSPCPVVGKCFRKHWSAISHRPAFITLMVDGLWCVWVWCACERMVCVRVRMGEFVRVFLMARVSALNIH